MNIKVLVATHKNYEMPKDTDTYLPIFVGKDIHPNVNQTFQGDNTGINISKKNSTYNELTAIYWGWKNLDADAIGLVHYRRYLSATREKDLDSVLNRTQIETMLNKYDIILPNKRRYFVESNESHYLHAHHNEPLNVMKQVVSELYPDYEKSYNLVMKRTWAHMFNMFIMKKKPFDEYCEFMFSVLAEVEKRVDISEYDAYESRVFGFISELLLDVWLEVHDEYKVTEAKYVFMEKQNWLIKGSKFLIRKMRGHG